MIIDESYWCPDCGTTHSVDIECDHGCDECGFHTWPYYRVRMDGNHGSSRVCKDCYIFDQGRGFYLALGKDGRTHVEDAANEYREIASFTNVEEAGEFSLLLAVGRRHLRDDIISERAVR